MKNYLTDEVPINFRYMIPKGTKNIEIIDEIENIGGINIFYTKTGKSFAEHQMETVHQVTDKLVGV